MQRFDDLIWFVILFIFVRKSTRQIVFRYFLLLLLLNRCNRWQFFRFVLIFFVRCTKTNEKAKNLINEIETSETTDLVVHDGLLKNGTNNWRRKEIITFPEPEAYCVVSFHFRLFIIIFFFFRIVIASLRLKRLLVFLWISNETYTKRTRTFLISLVVWWTMNEILQTVYSISATPSSLYRCRFRCKIQTIVLFVFFAKFVVFCCYLNTTHIHTHTHKNKEKSKKHEEEKGWFFSSVVLEGFDLMFFFWLVVFSQNKFISKIYALVDIMVVNRMVQYYVVIMLFVFSIEWHYQNQCHTYKQCWHPLFCNRR